MLRVVFGLQVEGCFGFDGTEDARVERGVKGAGGEGEGNGGLEIEVVGRELEENVEGELV